MAEKMGEVYEAYDMEVQGIGRGRGAIILMTDKGIRQVAALNGTDERLLQEKQFKDSIYAVHPISGIWRRQSSIWHSFIKPAGNSMRMREAVNMIKCQAISTEN